MKNYNKSDYALNKYSKNIIYRSVKGIVEVTPEEYLAENPDKSKNDFIELKKLSDAIYLEQDRNDYKLCDVVHSLPMGADIEKRYIQNIINYINKVGEITHE